MLCNLQIVEEREEHTRSPPMDPREIKKCRELWPRTVSGFDRLGHPVIWDGAAEITAPKMQAIFGTIANGCDHTATYTA